MLTTNRTKYWVRVKIIDLLEIIFVYLNECNVIGDIEDFFCWYFCLSYLIVITSQ